MTDGKEKRAKAESRTPIRKKIKTENEAKNLKNKSKINPIIKCFFFSPFSFLNEPKEKGNEAKTRGK